MHTNFFSNLKLIILGSRFESAPRPVPVPAFRDGRNPASCCKENEIPGRIQYNECGKFKP